jgi:hypothetical protein
LPLISLIDAAKQVRIQNLKHGNQKKKIKKEGFFMGAGLILR